MIMISSGVIVIHLALPLVIKKEEPDWLSGQVFEILIDELINI